MRLWFGRRRPDRLAVLGRRLGRVGRSAHLATSWRGRHRTAWPAAGKQPALLRRHAFVVARRALLPPLAQQTEHLGRQHDVAVLAPFGLHDTDDVLGAVDVADPEPDHLAGAQATAIAERESAWTFEVPAMARRRFASSGLMTSGSLCGSLRW